MFGATVSTLTVGYTQYFTSTLQPSATSTVLRFLQLNSAHFGISCSVDGMYTVSTPLP